MSCPKEHLALFQGTYGAASAAVFVLAPPQEICLFSEGALALLGLADDALPRTLDDFAAVDSLEEPHSLALHARRELQTSSTKDWNGVLRGTPPRHLRATFLPLPPIDGSPYHLCHLHTEGPQIGALANTRRKLERAMEELPSAVLLFDTDGRVIHLNRRAKVLVGRDTWDVLGQEDHPFMPRDPDGKALPRDQWPLFKALQTRKTYKNLEVMLDFGDAHRVLSIDIVPVRDGDEISFFLVTGRDITQRTERDRRKDDFLSIASHELRSPLTPLTGLLQIARKRLEEGGQVELPLLERAESQVLRLRRLIESLLDLSRIETGKLAVDPEPTEMTDLLHQIMDPWLRGPQSDRIHLTTPSTALFANVDPHRVEQVVTNLVDNALKHGPDSGAIKVVLSTEDDQARISVCDDGDGLDQDVIDRIYSNSLFTTRQSRSPSGLGLGLFITRQIVESHGGELLIDSTANCRTRISATFPTIAAP